MVATPFLLRIPSVDSGAATFVQIGINGGDPDNAMQFLINDVVRGTIPISALGSGRLLYAVPAGPQRNALANLQHGDGSWETVDGINLVHVEDGNGDSMSLRYRHLFLEVEEPEGITFVVENPTIVTG